MTSNALPPLAAALDDRLGSALSGFAQALAVPVLIAALLLLAFCALEVGRYVAEALRRRRARRALSLTALIEHTLRDPEQAVALAARAPSAISEVAIIRIGQIAATGRWQDLESLLDDIEHEIGRRLDRTRILVRSGPAVGLMGTLIPLAPGLQALGRGDVAMLAHDLRIAFAATVVGLLVGTVAFALTTVRSRAWQNELAQIERATEYFRAQAHAALTASAEALA